MFIKQEIPTNKQEAYSLLLAQASHVLEDGVPWYTNAANLASLISIYLDNLNWIGLYVMNQGRLVLGPFQGLPGCTLIEVGKGVCGTAAATKQTQNIPNVHAFEGHIACDSASNSELVVPVLINNEVVAVWDMDSPIFDRFSEEDVKLIESLVQILANKWRND